MVQNMSAKSHREMHLSVLRVLGFHRPQVCLTPNLKKLNWHTPVAWLSGVLMFLSSSVKCLKATCLDLNKLLILAIPLVPDLTTVDLHCDESYSTYDIAINLSKLSRIRHIRLKGETTDHDRSLTCLTSLRHLEYLDIDLESDTELPVLSPTSFSALRSLSICCDPEQTADIIKALDPPSMIHLKISFRDIVTGDELIGTFEAIRQLKNNTDLQVVHIGIPFDLDTTTVTTDDMQPLLQISSLQQLHFDGSLVWDVSDDDIETISKSWPLLTRLRLEHTGFQQPTLKGLLCLVSNLPHLRDVGMGIDGISIPHTDYTSAEVYPHLLSLRLVSEAEVGDSGAVARFLSLTFPNACFTASPSPGTSDETETHRRWEQVAHLAPMFQAVRREEELRYRYR